MSVVDISCPECDAVAAVRKLSLGRYRCDDCQREFTPDELNPGRSDSRD